jgi:protein gp37
MASTTGIEWTDATWNPVAGCSLVSPGCTNCYAMKMAARVEAMAKAQGKPSHYAGTTQPSKAGAVWTGKVNLAPDSILYQPLRWKRPRKIFVNSMSDLFQKGVSEEWLDLIFTVMQDAHWHTFQILTKRAEEMRDYMKCHYPKNPPKNIWLGVSVEDQERARERVPALLDTPAAIRFLSCEPLLDAIDLQSNLGGTLWIGGQRGCDGTHIGNGTPDCPAHRHHHHDDRCQRGIDWVIAGGESGTGARAIQAEWARSLRDQCAAAGVPFFFKQWGEWAPDPEMPSELQEHYELRGEWEGTSCRIGKKKAGNHLDGRQHLEFPRVAA